MEDGINVGFVLSYIYMYMEEEISLFMIKHMHVSLHTPKWKNQRRNVTKKLTVLRFFLACFLNLQVGKIKDYVGCDSVWEF